MIGHGLRGALPKYEWLQSELRLRDVSRDREYQTRFGGFYRVRRNADWRRVFYDILERGKAKRPTLRDVLLDLYTATRRIEASFASKLIATLEPASPVIDSVVLRNLDLKLPPHHDDPTARITAVINLHATMAQTFCNYLASEDGRYLVAQFHAQHPRAALTAVKILDLVLWQTRRAADRSARPPGVRGRRNQPHQGHQSSA